MQELLKDFPLLSLDFISTHCDVDYSKVSEEELKELYKNRSFSNPVFIVRGTTQVPQLLMTVDLLFPKKFKFTGVNS